MSSEPSSAIQIVQKFHDGVRASDRDLERALGIVRSGERRYANLATLLHRYGNQNFTFEATPFHALRDVFRIIKPHTDELFCDAGAGYGHAIFYGACITGCRFRAIEILPARCEAMRKTAARLGLHSVEIVEGDALQQSYADVTYLLVNSPFFTDNAQRFVELLSVRRTKPLTVIALHNIASTFRSAPAFTEIGVAVDMPSYYFGVFRLGTR